MSPRATPRVAPRRAGRLVSGGALIFFIAALTQLEPSCTGTGIGTGDAAGGAGGAPCDCCLADPVDHCVSVRACHDGRQCPAGTTCTVPPVKVKLTVPAGFEVCGKTVAPGSWCGAVGGVTSVESLLTNGFGVEDLALNKTKPPDGTVEISWSGLPAETEAVACAIFGCPPIIGPGSQADLTDNPLPAILNWNQCVLYAASYDPADNAFPLGLIGDGHEIGATDAGTACDAAPVPIADEHPPITTLAVGCWAYGTAGIVQASRLLDLRPEELRPDNGFVKASCGDGSEPGALDGWSCVVQGLPAGDARVFGTCHGNVCLRRCVASWECDPRSFDNGTGGSPGSGGSGGKGTGGSASTGTGGGASSKWCCVPPAQGHHYLGVCVEQPSGAPGAACPQ
jgi:uncharacterized membrane protein YgcG